MPSTDPSAVRLSMYPLPTATQPQRAKRRQVKNACTNCQKACKKCDDARPCLRCVKYGMQEACVSSQRKERKKGVKRGPYKKRESKGPLELPFSEFLAYSLPRPPRPPRRLHPPPDAPSSARSPSSFFSSPSPIHVAWPPSPILSLPPFVKDH